MQKVFLVPLFVVSLFFGALPASALADRVALVVGNASYQHATQLDNPINDASLIASKLTELGFKVLLVMDATFEDFTEALREFEADLQTADTGMFYYAGH